MFDQKGIGSVADVIRKQATARPNEVAQVFHGRETSFAELDRRSNKVAQGLLAEGCKPESRIGFIGKNSDLFFELLYGSLKTKSVLVSINWRLAAPEIVYIINDSGAELIFVGAEFHDILKKVLPECPTVRRVIAVDGADDEWTLFETWRDRLPAVDPELQHHMDDDTVQIYTSGTTGHPKGVQLSNKAYLAAFNAQTQTWADFKPGEVQLIALPNFHVAGINPGLIGHAVGVKNVILKEVDPVEMMKVIEKERVNVTFMAPAVMLILIQHKDIQKADFSSLRRILYGAAPITEDLLASAREVFQTEFMQLYGLTETNGSIAFLSPVDHDPAKGKLRSCGRPCPGSIIRVADENDNEVPVGTVGEVQVQTDMVLKAYWNKPEATTECLRGGWFHTGDAGYFDEDGYLYIYDRIKNMIVSGGENVYPAEVENALAGHPAVADVAVIGVPDQKWGEAVKACIVLQPGQTATQEELIAYARTRIAGYKVPKSVDFLAALPRNPSGKILHRELRVPYWKDHHRMVN